MDSRPHAADASHPPPLPVLDCASGVFYLAVVGYAQGTSRFQLTAQLFGGARQVRPLGNAPHIQPPGSPSRLTRVPFPSPRQVRPLGRASCAGTQAPFVVVPKKPLLLWGDAAGGGAGGDGHGAEWVRRHVHIQAARWQRQAGSPRWPNKKPARATLALRVVPYTLPHTCPVYVYVPCQVTVTVTPEQGDPDLYVKLGQPGGTAPDPASKVWIGAPGRPRPGTSRHANPLPPHWTPRARYMSKRCRPAAHTTPPCSFAGAFSWLFPPVGLSFGSLTHRHSLPSRSLSYRQVHYDYHSTHAAMASETVVVPETALAACGAGAAGPTGGCWVSIYVDGYSAARYSVLVAALGTPPRTSFLVAL